MKKNSITTILLCASMVASAQPISLQRAKEMAVENNYSLKNSLLAVSEAKAQVSEAKTNYFPKVNAMAFGMKAIDPLIKFHVDGGNLPVYDGNLSNLASATQYAYMPAINMNMLNQLGLGALTVVQPIYAGNRIRTGNKLAALNLEVKQTQQSLSQKKILFNTEKQYWQVVNLKENEKTLTAYEDFLDKLYKEVENAEKNGVVIKNDLLKVKIKRSELKVKRMQLEDGIALSVRQFCQTIGVPYTTTLNFCDRPDEADLPQSYYIEENQALKQRNEYQLLEKSVKASQLQTELSRGEMRPSFNVGLSGYYLNMFESGTESALNGMVFAQMSIPISGLWEGKHKVRQYKAKEQIAENQLKDNSDLLCLQMDKAWRDLNEAFKTIQFNEEILEQTTENRRVNMESYQNGFSQMSDLLDAEAQVNDTENKLIEAKINYKLAIANYLIVTGR